MALQSRCLPLPERDTQIERDTHRERDTHTEGERGERRKWDGRTKSVSKEEGPGAAQDVRTSRTQVFFSLS